MLGGQAKFACLITFLVVILILAFVALLNRRWRAVERLEQAQVWALPGAWRPTSCKILSVGVTCVEVDTGGACWGLAWSGDAIKMQQINEVLVFDHADSPVCPGSHWCAGEGQDCLCDGEVTFAPVLFDGREHPVGKDEFQRFTQTSRGKIKCGRDKYGEPYKDTRLGTKQCWCTPEPVLQMLRRHGTTVPELAERSNRAQRALEQARSSGDYFGVPTRRLGGDPGPAAPVAAASPADHDGRRALVDDSGVALALTADYGGEPDGPGGNSAQAAAQAAAPSPPPPPKTAGAGDDDDDDDDDDSPVWATVLDVDEADDGDDNDGDADEEELEGGGGFAAVRSRGRRLGGSSSDDSRRRRTFSYTPWALVETPRLDTGGLEATGASPVVTCAYEHGAPGALWNVHITDGADNWFPWQSDNEAEQITLDWVNRLDHSETAQCFARVQGPAGADMCEVGMEPPEDLVDHLESMVWWRTVGLVVYVGILLCFAGLAGPPFFQYAHDLQYAHDRAV